MDGADSRCLESGLRVASCRDRVARDIRVRVARIRKPLSDFADV